MIHWPNSNQGLTLIELVIVIVIAGILATVALKSLGIVTQTARVEQTKNEMEKLSFAIVGNPTLENNGVRTDFGYVGDVGSMPPNLDALFTNPGGYGTWNGPYIKRRFSQITNDYKEDAWGIAFTYSLNNITSTGSGSNIVRKMGNAVADFTTNQVSGLVLDLDDTPPGNTYKDSITVRLTVPNGSGGIVYKTATPGPGGYFSFDSIPIGNHDIEVVYEPDNDTLSRFVSVLPVSNPYGEYTLASNVWYGAGVGSGDLILVPGSAYPHGGSCDHFHFTIQNTSGVSINISSLVVTWSTPAAYYEKIKWGGTDVFNSNNPRSASTDTSNFSASQTITSGSQVELKIEKFKTNQTGGGGSKVAVDNTTFTVLFSDGSTFDINLGACQ